MEEVNMAYINTCEFVCVYCGKQLSAHSRKRQQLYCGSKCRKKYARATTPEERQRNREIIKSVRCNPEQRCRYCGESFHSPAWANRQYCSQLCYRKSRTAKAAESHPETQCEFCGETFSYPPRKKRKYCSDTCRNNAASEAIAALNPEKAGIIDFGANLASEKFVCVCCGKELENGAKNLKLYCNGSCAYYYNKMTTPEERAENRKILESGRLRRMQTQEFRCAYCNETFTALPHQKRQYCSHACHNKAQIEYFAAIDDQKLTEVIERVKDTKAIAEYICIYCGKTLPEGRQVYCDEKCKRGYEKITTFEEREQNRELIKKIRLFPEKQCAYCGEPFAASARYHQQYCSAACKDKAQSIYHAEIAEIKIRETSERLYRVLTTGEPICIYCGEQLPRNDNGRLFCSKQCIAAFHNKRRPKKFAPSEIVKTVNGQSHYRYNATNNAEEWRGILQTEMQINYFETSGIIDCQKSVRLMCASTNVSRSAHSFAAIIASKGLNPFDGDYYAFCGGLQDKIRYIQFDGNGFQMVSRQNEYGKYSWPSEKYGEFVTLTAQEFEFVLKGSNPPRFSEKIIL